VAAGTRAIPGIRNDNVKNFTNFSCTRRARLLNNALGFEASRTTFIGG
jgi:hypothetical protein